MGNILYNTKKKALSEHDAVNLLFDNDGLDNNIDYEYIDEYGNYVFPTDFVANTPNTASGSSFSFTTISLFPKDEE